MKSMIFDNLRPPRKSWVRLNIFIKLCLGLLKQHQVAGWAPTVEKEEYISQVFSIQWQKMKKIGSNSNQQTWQLYVKNSVEILNRLESFAFVITGSQQNRKFKGTSVVQLKGRFYDFNTQIYDSSLITRQLLIIKVVQYWLTAVNFKIDESGRTIAMDVEPNFTYEGGYGRKVSYKFLSLHPPILIQALEMLLMKILDLFAFVSHWKDKGGQRGLGACHAPFNCSRTSVGKFLYESNNTGQITLIIKMNKRYIIFVFETKFRVSHFWRKRSKSIVTSFHSIKRSKFRFSRRNNFNTLMSLIQTLQVSIISHIFFYIFVE